jgi:hypothetical protein
MQWSFIKALILTCPVVCCPPHSCPVLQIVAAVRQGRRVWDNLRKILLFNLPVNFAQGGAICESRYAPYMPSCNLACKSSGGKRMPRIVLMQFAKTLHS